jgi:biopolymer transport protein ExbD
MSVLAVDGKGMLMLEGAGVPEGLLDSYLQAWRKINPSRKLEIEADEKAPFGKMVEVWGALNRLGIEVMPTRARLSEPVPTP